MSDLSDELEAAAAKPKQITIDGNTVSQHSLKELIDADRYLRQQTASDQGKRPFTLFKLRPGSAV